MLMAAYDLGRWGPTTNNTTPARFVFVMSKEAKQRLKPHLNKGNVEQTMSAPATAIIAYDMHFYDKMDKLSPNPGAKESWSQKSPAELAEAAAAEILRALISCWRRARWPDCGLMGFDNAGVDREFFAGTRSSPISCAISAMAMKRPSGLAPGVSNSMKPAGSFSRAGAKPR
jgi:3-hydroxypropanoate dehydrogenase